MERDPISQSLVNPAKDFFSDIADIGIDELIELVGKNTELLEKIPIVKWFFIANDVRSILQTAFFVRKYANFIGPIKDYVVIDEGEIKKLNNLFESDKNYKRLIEYSIIEIDRYQNEQKAKLLGVLFKKTFKENIFIVSEYNSLLFSIESMHPFTGIETLKKFYKYRRDMDSEIDETTRRKIWTEGANIDYSSLATTGFLSLPKGGAYLGDIGGAYLNEFGKKFVENVVLPCENKN